MKTINKYMCLLAVIAVALSGCKNDIEREASPTVGTDVVAFKGSSATVDINPMKSALEYAVTVVRSSTDEDLTVGIGVADGDNDIINVPENISFAKGESAATLLLTFPNAELDSTYSVRLTIQEKNQSPYLDGASTFDFTVNIATWETSATQAIFVDGIVNIWFATPESAWYVEYESKQNSDGSSDYRFFNPYSTLPRSSEPDQFGIYDAYPWNAPGDTDEDNDYPMTMHINADGTAYIQAFDLGMDWDYGMLKAGTAEEAFGQFDAETNSVTFPAGTLLCAMADYANGAYNVGTEDMVIYLDATAYQNDHLQIADFNSADIEWEEVESEVNLFESTIFNFTNEEQKLFKAVNPLQDNPKSPYINLYCLKDVYAAGGNLAFYWDGEDGELDVPANQNTKLSFMQQDLYIVDAIGNVTTSDVKGIPVKVFTFDIIVATQAGNLVGEYIETFSLANAAIVFSKSDYIGNFTLTGDSQWAGEEPADMPVEIKEDGEDLILLGVQFCDTIRLGFDAESGAISIEPQQLGDYGPYDITLYTSVDGEADDEAALTMAFGLSGVAKITADSEADGYFLVSETAEGAVDGYKNLKLTPAADQAPRRTPAAIQGAKDPKNLLHSGQRNTPNVSHLQLQGKYRPKMRKL